MDADGAARVPSPGVTHLLLGAQSLVIVLVSVNRLGGRTLSFVSANEFLRWVDLWNLVLGLAGLLVSYLLIHHVSHDVPAVWGRRWGTPALGLLLMIGAYLLASGYGDHEVTNYLHGRFCDGDPGTRWCEIVVFHDDGFSHWLFFAGFTLVSLVVMLAQHRHPAPRPPSAGGVLLLALNALLIAAGIVANLGFERIGPDLWVVAAVAVTAVTLAARRRGQPILIYYAIAYASGLAVTLLVIAARGL